MDERLKQQTAFALEFLIISYRRISERELLRNEKAVKEIEYRKEPIMQDYEMYHEIINQCPLNHSRDQYIEEITCKDPDSYLQEMFRKEGDVRIEKTELKDGSISYEVFASGLHHRFTFTAF